MNRTKIFSIGLLALLTAGSASPANAQQGKFVLPFEAHWGRVTLKPGTYTIQVPPGTGGLGVLRLSGAKESVLILAIARDKAADPKRSYLRIENAAGTRFVREFNSVSAGTLFQFSVPKTVHIEAQNEQKGHRETVAVTTPGSASAASTGTIRSSSSR